MNFTIMNKATASRDCVAKVWDSKTDAEGHFALMGYTGDGEYGDCIYMQSGFRDRDAEAALVMWGWI